MLPSRAAKLRILHTNGEKNASNFPLTHRLTLFVSVTQIWEREKVRRNSNLLLGSFIFHVRSFVSPLSLTRWCICFSFVLLFLVRFAERRVVSIFTQPESEAHPLAFSFSVHSNCSSHYSFQHRRRSAFTQANGKYPVRNLFDGKHSNTENDFNVFPRSESNDEQP